MIAAAASNQYVSAAQLADNLPGVKGAANGNLAAVAGQIPGPDDGVNYKWIVNPAFNLTPTAAVNGSEAAGWAFLPTVPGFDLREDLRVLNKYGNESGIMPYYLSQQDPTQIKRFIVVLPGKPRDIWKYANYMLNARNIPVGQQSAPWNTWGVTNNSVGIVAPAFLNLEDRTAGACKADYLCFSKSLWQEGGESKLPVMNHSISSFTALDAILDTLFNKTLYPALNQVVVAGHSLGGQATQRYAVMKKTKAYDSNVRFWIGNPGSWVWLSSNRPYNNGTCNGTYGQWPYGFTQNTNKITKYARKDITVDGGKQVIQRFQGRTVAYALALFDTGTGDTHCEADWQGSNQ